MSEEKVNFYGHQEWAFDILKKLEGYPENLENLDPLELITAFLEKIHEEGWEIIRKAKK